MLTAIKGIYANGKVILTEEPPLTTKTDVIVTFLSDEENQKDGKQKIILGLLEGKIDTPDDFDEPIDDLKDYM